MRRLTILHLAANRWWTGSADPTIQLVQGLRARGHRVLLGVIPGDRFEAKARETGLDLVEGLKLSPGALGADTLRVRALIRSQDVDVVHAHHSHDHWLALVARPPRPGRGRPPVVRTFHNLRAVKHDRLARSLYRWTRAGGMPTSRQRSSIWRETAKAAAVRR